MPNQKQCVLLHVPLMKPVVLISTTRSKMVKKPLQNKSIVVNQMNNSSLDKIIGKEFFEGSQIFQFLISNLYYYLTRQVYWVLLYPASHPKHISYRKLYFNEFVANALSDNMSMIIFELRGCGGCQRPKTSYLGAHSMFGSSHTASSAYQRFNKK